MFTKQSWIMKILLTKYVSNKSHKVPKLYSCFIGKIWHHIRNFIKPSEPKSEWHLIITLLSCLVRKPFKWDTCMFFCSNRFLPVNEKQISKQMESHQANKIKQTKFVPHQHKYKVSKTFSFCMNLTTAVPIVVGMVTYDTCKELKKTAYWNCQRKFFEITSFAYLIYLN